MEEPASLAVDKNGNLTELMIERRPCPDGRAHLTRYALTVGVQLVQPYASTSFNGGLTEIRGS